MRCFRVVIIFTLSILSGIHLFAQTHVSVPVGHAVYYLLDLAEARGLCPPLPAVKPYTRARVVEAINEILAAEPGRFGALTGSERKILEDARAEFTVKEAGLDLREGKYRVRTQGKKGVRFTGDIGIAVDSLHSGAYYQQEGEGYYGTDTWVSAYFEGDVGEHLSYGLEIAGGLMRARRSYLGEYDTFATELTENEADGDVNQRVMTFSQPKAYFPYTYQKHWDGFLFSLGNMNASSMESWPEKLGVGPKILSELSGSVFGDALLLRAGRFQREWGAMTPGNSLVFNAAARPFIAVEMLFNPSSWFSYSSLTGVLEYYNANGIVESAKTFQNAFSIGQLEFNVGNYFHIDFGSAAIWSKRFELGYLFPLQNNFLYQNFIGDFDNLSMHLNLRGRYPGLGGIWLSFYMDETDFSNGMKSLFEMNRQMFAFQAGLQGVFYPLPFASYTVSYTRVEPYTYSHTRSYTPWHSGDSPMEVAYVNNGVCLGYYLPPNSDEIKLRFDLRFAFRSAGHFQYQLIRHGADYGPHQVDGSSLVSELDPSGRSEKASLKKSFLKDGAYQWMHIIKIGGEHKFRKLPLTIYGEAGVAFSYFTDISDAEYAKYTPTPEGADPRPQAAGEYLKSTAYILSLGFRIFR